MVSLRLFVDTNPSGFSSVPRLTGELGNGTRFRIDLLGSGTWHRSHSPCCRAAILQARTRGAKPRCQACEREFLRSEISGKLDQSMESLLDGVNPLEAVLMAEDLGQRARAAYDDYAENPRVWTASPYSYEGELRVQ